MSHAHRVALTLVLAATLALPTGVRAAAPTAIRIPTSEANRARRYWTPARMAHARPLNLARPRWPKDSTHQGQTTAPTATVTPAETIADPTAPGVSQYGVVFGTGFLGLRFRCSGTSVSAPNLSLVVTAGHCVNFIGTWASHSWAFVPAYRYGERPFGVFVAHWLGTTPGWLEQENPNYDVGMAVVSRNERGQTLAEAVGADRFASGLPRDHAFDVYGYPVAEPFTGATLQRCRQAPFVGSDLLSFFLSGPLDVGVRCGFTDGSSGGGWVISGDRINGVTSRGYPDDPSSIYGPYFGREVAKLYARARRVK